MSTSDTTLLYYTASLLPVAFADRVRTSLIISNASGFPIVSVSQLPLKFGHSITVGNLGASIHTCYSQILTGVCHVRTRFTVCCEDDTLYAPQHLSFIPPRDDTFYYNYSRYAVDPSGVYWRRDRGGMCMCVCNTELLRDTLTARLKKFPSQRDPMVRYFSEPGKYEDAMGLPHVPLQSFNTEIPSLTFNHRPSLGGVRKVRPTDEVLSTLPYWGPASVLWSLYDPNSNAPRCTRERTEGGFVTRLAEETP